MLLDDWHSLAYQATDQKEIKRIWDKYFKEEKEIYKSILDDPDTEITGTVSSLSEKYNMDILYFVGFLEGINDSLEKSNPIEKLKESSKIKIKINKEKLYYNMVLNKADWLYNLPQWDNILTNEKRNELYKECKNSQIVKRESNKVYPNDLCPCGSGKKYKKCCGKNAS